MELGAILKLGASCRRGKIGAIKYEIGEAAEGLGGGDMGSGCSHGRGLGGVRVWGLRQLALTLPPR